MTTPTDQREYEALDIPIEPPAATDIEYEELPSGIYPARLIGFRQVEKPAFKIQQELLRHPEKDPDKLQWQWSFEAVWDDALVPIGEWTSRSWHKRAKAAAIACALLGVTELPRGAGFTTKGLIGLPCQLFVVEGKEKDDGSKGRSYIDKVLPAPKRRQNPAPAPVRPASEDPEWQATMRHDPGPEDPE